MFHLTVSMIFFSLRSNRKEAPRFFSHAVHFHQNRLNVKKRKADVSVPSKGLLPPRGVGRPKSYVSYMSANICVSPKAGRTHRLGSIWCHHPAPSDYGSCRFRFVFVKQGQRPRGNLLTLRRNRYEYKFTGKCDVCRRRTEEHQLRSE